MSSKTGQAERSREINASPSAGQASWRITLGKAVQNLLTSNKDPNTVDAHGVTPLMWAAMAGLPVTDIHALIARGAQIDARDTRGWTALSRAARRGQLDIVEALLNAGASADLPDDDGWTALFWAARHGHARVVARLLASGADRVWRNWQGATALDYALRSGDLATIVALSPECMPPLLANRLTAIRDQVASLRSGMAELSQKERAVALNELSTHVLVLADIIECHSLYGGVMWRRAHGEQGDI